MNRPWLRMLAVGSIVMAGSLPAWGQPPPFIEFVTGFEGSWPPYVVDSSDCEVIFRDPRNASTTEAFVVPSPNDSFVASSTGGLAGFVVPSSGTQANLSYWLWEDPAQHIAWVRLQTTKTAYIPNPGIHLAGKVRFYLGGTAYTDESFATEVGGPNYAQIYLGLGVRESGAGVPLGTDGGIAGAIEWVGVDKLVEILAGTNGFCDTTADPLSDDVQVLAPGTPAGPDDVCVDGGPNGVMDTPREVDDGLVITPKGLIAVPLDRTMRLYEFDLPALELSGDVHSFNEGDGALLATPNNRGTLEHLVLTNDPANAGKNANLMLLWVDDVEFEAPIPDPPVISISPEPPRPLDANGVKLEGLGYGTVPADLVEVYVQGVGGDPDYLLGSLKGPVTGTATVPTSIVLPFNIFIYAQQTVARVLSDNSIPMKVSTPGNAPLRTCMAVRETDLYDHDLNCGDNGTGFVASAPSNLEWIGSTGHEPGSWGTPVNARRIEPEFGWREVIFDPCTDDIGLFTGNGVIATNGVPHTNGVWEGLYFRIDDVAPAMGPYTIYIDDMRVLVDGVEYCLIDDFEGYTIGDFIVEGEVTGTPPNAYGTAGTLAAGDDVQEVALGAQTYLGQIIISAGPNGVLDSTPASGEYVDSIHARFDTPGTAGTDVGVADDPALSAITDEEAYSGTQSLKIEWAFVNASNIYNHLRLTTNEYLYQHPNPSETMLMPDPVIPFTLDGTWCDGSNDFSYSFMFKMEPSPLMGDCDHDGDVDLSDAACFQECFGTSPLSTDCDTWFDYYRDNDLDHVDWVMFQLSMSGPQ